MCGIISVAFYDELDEAKSLDVLNFGKSSLRHLNHRGPDNSDIHLINNRVLMGHTRLSINGLVSEFNQPYPLRNIEDNLPRIIFNGEIFNFKELDASAMCDTKVLFNVLKRSNLNKAKLEESLRSLNGMWSFVYYQENKLIISRDRFGEKPLFFFESEGFIIFSSEIFALQVFLDKYVENFSKKDIREFPSASYSIIDLEEDKNKGVSFTKYYGEELEGSKKSVYDFEKLFSQAVSRRLISDVPLAFTLSGGLDSSAVVAQAAKFMNPKSLSAYCAVPSSGFSEIEWAKKASEEIGCNLSIVSYTPEEYIQAFKFIQKKIPKDIRSPSAIVHYLVFKQIEEDGFKVVLEGQGADEIFGGYLHSEVRFFISCLFTFKFKSLNQINKRIFSKNKLSDIWLLFVTELLRLKWLNMGFSDIHRNVYEDPLPSLVKYGDLVSMLNSVESRNPFLDHEIFEFACHQNDADRFLVKDSKKSIRDLLKKLSVPSIASRPDKIGYELPWKDLLLNVKEANELPSFNQAVKSAQLNNESIISMIYHFTVMHCNFIFGYKRSFIAYFKYRVLCGWDEA